MSPSKAIIPNDNQLECRHVVGMTAGNYPMVYIDEQLRWTLDGGVAFQYCPLCGLELDEDPPLPLCQCGRPADVDLGICGLCLLKIEEEVR